MQLLTELLFDNSYVIKTVVGFETVEMPRFLNCIGSYSFASKNNQSENFRKFSVVEFFVHKSFNCIKIPNLLVLHNYGLMKMSKISIFIKKNVLG